MCAYHLVACACHSYLAMWGLREVETVLRLMASARRPVAVALRV